MYVVMRLQCCTSASRTRMKTNHRGLYAFRCACMYMSCFFLCAILDATHVSRYHDACILKCATIFDEVRRINKAIYKRQNDNAMAIDDDVNINNKKEITFGCLDDISTFISMLLSE